MNRVEARSVIIGGLVLIAASAVAQVVLNVVVPGYFFEGFSGDVGPYLYMAVGLVLQAAAAIGAALVGAGVVLQALERAGVLPGAGRPTAADGDPFP